MVIGVEVLCASAVGVREGVDVGVDVDVNVAVSIIVGVAVGSWQVGKKVLVSIFEVCPRVTSLYALKYALF